MKKKHRAVYIHTNMKFHRKNFWEKRKQIEQNYKKGQQLKGNEFGQSQKNLKFFVTKFARLILKYYMFNNMENSKKNKQFIHYTLLMTNIIS